MSKRNLQQKIYNLQRTTDKLLKLIVRYPIISF